MPRLYGPGLRLIRPAASPLGGSLKGSREPGMESPAESEILVTGLGSVKEGMRPACLSPRAIGGKGKTATIGPCR